MVFIVLALVLLSFIGVRFQKVNAAENTYLNKSTTNCIRGFFILLIIICGLLNVIPAGTLNKFDTPLKILSLGGTVQGLSLSLGGLLFVPFFFYSGFGIFETYKNQGKEYARKIPLQQILRHYLSYFIAWVFFAITALAMKYNYSVNDYLLSAIGLSTIGNENWFVFIMIFMYLFSFVAIRIADKKTAVIINIVLATLFLFILIRFDVPNFCWNTTFAYLFGIVFSYLKERIEAWLFKNKYNRFFILGISTALFVGSLFMIDTIPYGDFRAFMFIFPTLFLCMALVSFTSIFKFKNRFLNFIGSNSFWMYMLYLLPFIWFKKVSFICDHKYLYLVLTLVSTIAFAVVLNKAFNYIWNVFAKNHGDASEASNMRIGVVLSYVTLVVSALGALVVTPRIVDYLGYDNYGLLSFATSITAWLAVISSALGSSYIRFASKQKNENKDLGLVNTSYVRIFGILAVSIVLIVVGVVLAFLLFDIKLPQYSFEQNRTILYSILISGITVAINVMYSVFNSHLMYKKQFIFVRLLVLLTSFFTFMGNLIFAFISRNVLSISFVSMVMTTISTVLTIFFALKNQKMEFTKARFKETTPLMKAIIAFSSFVLLNYIVDQINVNLDKTILGIMVDATAVADYTFAKYFNTYFFVLANAITMIYTPKIHELVAKDPDIIVDKNAVKEYYNSLISVELNNYLDAKKAYKETKLDPEERRKASALLKVAKRELVLKRGLAQKETRKYIQSIKENVDKKENKVELSSLFLKICSSQMLILFLVAGGYIAVGEEFMGLWLGADRSYIYFYAIAPILLDLFVLTAHSGLEIQRALNKHKFRAILYVCLAVINIGISIAMIKILPDGYQVWGAFIGTIFAVVVGNIILIDLYNKSRIGLPMGRYLINFAKHVGYAGAGVGVAMGFKYALPIISPSYLSVPTAAKMIVQGIVFVIIYFVLLFIFERKTLMPIVKKVVGKLKAAAKGGNEQ